MGDEARIHVEPGDGSDSGGADGDWTGSDVSSSRRVVHEPTRRGRVAAVVVLAGLVLGGAALSLGGGSGDDRPDRPDEPRELSARDAYIRAIGGLGRARTFAYHGTVRAAGPSQLQPGTWLAAEVTVEGAVLLPHSITHEVATAVDDDGDDGVVDTITSGATVWSRTATSSSALADAPWTRVPWQESVDVEPLDTVSFEAGRLGVARLLDVLRVAEDRRRGPADAEGNRTLRATVPAGTEDQQGLGDLAGAEVMLALDEGGDITDITLTSTTGERPRLLVELAIDRLGEPGLIAPADIGAPIRSAVPVAYLEAAGIRPLEPSRLPTGWALTSARAARAGPSGMCGTAPGTGGCDIPEDCLVFQLGYNDLTEVLGGRLRLSILTDDCAGTPVRRGAAAGAPFGGAPFRAAGFAGWALEAGAETSGTMSDGEATIHFSTDLSLDDAATVLATLAPFDAAGEPADLPGVPSSSRS